MHKENWMVLFIHTHVLSFQHTAQSIQRRQSRTNKTSHSLITGNRIKSAKIKLSHRVELPFYQNKCYQSIIASNTDLNHISNYTISQNNTLTLTSMHTTIHKPARTPT